MGRDLERRTLLKCIWEISVELYYHETLGGVGMKRRGFLYIACLIVITSCPAWADLYEFSDAGGYGSAQHVTNGWQQLGDYWDTESGPLTVDLDPSDDGVDWSTDGGSNWGYSDLIKGQEVTFRFDMRRAPYGNHYYDQIKAWIDWDGDQVFDNTAEIILAEQWFKYDTNPLYNTLINDSDWSPWNNPLAILQQNYYVTLTVPDDAVLGTIWLRARVTCDHISFDDTTPYGELWQGEVEDYKLTITPIPSGVILAGIGLVVAQWRLKRKENLASS